MCVHCSCGGFILISNSLSITTFHSVGEYFWDLKKNREENGENDDSWEKTTPSWEGRLTFLFSLKYLMFQRKFWKVFNR